MICYQSAWDTLDKYYSITDTNHEIYAAATLMNLCAKKRYFELSWPSQNDILVMLGKNRSIWEANYRQNTPRNPPPVPDTFFDRHMANLYNTGNEQIQEDEFDRYIESMPIQLCDWKKANIYQWWATSPFPGLRQMAFDLLSIPAMSAELERVFAQAKRFFTDDRNRWTATSFEAVQCLKQWSTQGVYDVLERAPEELSEPIREHRLMTHSDG